MLVLCCERERVRSGHARASEGALVCVFGFTGRCVCEVHIRCVLEAAQVAVVKHSGCCSATEALPRQVL